MGYQYAYRSDIGMRESNQDSLVIKSCIHQGSKLFLAAVFDGLGGLSRGEVNSRRAAELLSDWFEKVLLSEDLTSEKENAIQSELNRAAEEINTILYRSNRAAGSAGGTTISVLLLLDGKRYLLHIGDSRIYELCGGKLTQLTRDHSFVAREVELGHMTAEEAKVSPKRNVLLQCLGAKPALDAPQIEASDAPEDASYLLATDGFWHFMEEQELIRQLSPGMAGAESMKRCLADMIARSRAAGEKDNATAIAVFPED